jgi:hypothetical protein
MQAGPYPPNMRKSKKWMVTFLTVDTNNTALS